MDKHEAKELLRTKLAEYRHFGYPDLVARLGEIECHEVIGPNGTKYQIEVQFFWDGKAGGDVRVSSRIDDGGLSAFAPLCEDYILTPEGKFVGP